jgi:hypothetical protein
LTTQFIVYLNFKEYYFYYEYNTKKEIISENKPVASAKANPKIAKVNNWFRTCGFRAVDAIKEEKINPIPIPAPINPEQANPAPIYFAATNILKFKKFYDSVWIILFLVHINNLGLSI